MTPNEQAELDALRAELAYVKAQPKVREDRVDAIEEQIKQREPQVEAAVVEAPEKAVHSKPRGRKAD